jgi:hypothetical protein
VFYILCSSVFNYVTLFVGPEEGTGRPENLTILVRVVLYNFCIWPCIYVVDPTFLGIECCWNIVLLIQFYSTVNRGCLLLLPWHLSEVRVALHSIL